MGIGIRPRWFQNDNYNDLDGYKDMDAKTKATEKDRTAREATEKIGADCDNILAFIKSVTVKAPRFAAAPLSLWA